MNWDLGEIYLMVIPKFEFPLSNSLLLMVISNNIPFFATAILCDSYEINVSGYHDTEKLVCASNMYTYVLWNV